MREFHKIWVEQCEAARDIRDAFGPQKALGYLIGEKFLNFLEAAEQDAAFACEVPRFVEEIKQIFDRAEIETYLNTVRRIGALGPRTSSASSARSSSCSPEPRFRRGRPA
jgi:NAD(P)H-flavin reductase